jgi:hypothetical protein
MKGRHLMATGLQRLVRRAALPHLKADTGLTALVPAESINPRGVPTWPFIALRAPVTQPLRASCVRGGELAFGIHAFAGPRLVAGAVVETGEDHAGRIGARIEALLDGVRMSIEGGGTAHLSLSDIRLLEDGDPDQFHWFAQLNARVLAA